MLQDLIAIDTSEPEDAPRGRRVGVLTALREALGRLDERFPRLSRWAGGRLDIEVRALAVSLSAHLLMLTALGSVGYAVHREAHRQFEGRVDTVLPAADMTTTTYQDLDQSADDRLVSAVAGSFAPELSTVNIAVSAAGGAGSVVRGVVGTTGAGGVDLAALDVRRATESIIPRATTYSRNVSIRGDGAEHVGSAEGAVDRIAQEVVRRLEQGRTLIVWAFDASGSLQAERKRLAGHIETVYSHVARLDAEGRAADGGLLTAVIAFGHDRRAMTEAPTADPAVVVAAIRAVPLDTTGVETTFQTVAEAVRKWGRYRDDKGNAYRAMIIVVTDEVGDDETHLEEAISLANERKTPVYVLGSQALFGRVEGRVTYTDPKTGHTFHNVPVRQGPESAMVEQVRLPFWYDGRQYDAIESGFGPYALSRLAGATGGIYFVTRLGETRAGFDPAAMREYRPDWISHARYEAEVNRHPIRRAVVQAALLTQQANLPGMPALHFPAADGPEFKEAMERNQALAARTAFTVNAALEPVEAAAKLRDREPSRRWQAHYDLARGRLLALKVRCDEYNWACARMKKDAPKFSRPESNAWRLVPDAEIRYTKVAAAAKEAAALLQKVVDQHPGTPWALLAARELKDPMGFRWVETHVRPPSRRDADPPAAKKTARMSPPSRPPELPKL
jgi:hypothetical protein